MEDGKTNLSKIFGKGTGCDQIRTLGKNNYDDVDFVKNGQQPIRPSSTNSLDRSKNLIGEKQGNIVHDKCLHQRTDSLNTLLVQESMQRSYGYKSTSMDPNINRDLSEGNVVPRQRKTMLKDLELM